MLRLAALLAERFEGGRAFFCNSGAEANEAALKIARKATGQDADRRARGRLPRAHARRALGHGPAVEVGGVRPARPRRLLRPPERRRVARGRARAGRRHGAPPARARARRGRRDPARARVRAGGGRARARDRRAALRRRGAGRDGPHGDVLRLRAARHPARSRHARQGPRQTGCRWARCSPASGPRRASCPATTARRSAAIPSPLPPPCAVVEAIDDELLAHVRERGAQLAAGLEALPAVRAVRGRGLLVGAELDRPVGPVVDACRDAGAARPLGRAGRAAADAAARRQRRRGRRRRSRSIESVLAS